MERPARLAGSWPRAYPGLRSARTGVAARYPASGLPTARRLPLRPRSTCTFIPDEQEAGPVQARELLNLSPFVRAHCGERCLPIPDRPLKHAKIRAERPFCGLAPLPAGHPARHQMFQPFVFMLPGEPLASQLGEITIGDEGIAGICGEVPVEVKVTLIPWPAVTRTLMPLPDPAEESLYSLPWPVAGIFPAPKAQLSRRLQVPVISAGRAGEVDGRPRERKVVRQNQLVLLTSSPAADGTVIGPIHVFPESWAKPRASSSRT